jgi:hypothetical protein
VKFLRQFGAVVAVVAVVVLIGLAWNDLAPSLPGEGAGGRAVAVHGQVFNGLPPGAAVPRGVKLRPGVKLPPPGTERNDGSGIPGLLLGDLLQPVNLVVLRNNALLETAVIGAVVIADVGYRRVRRARRRTG